MVTLPPPPSSSAPRKPTSSPAFQPAPLVTPPRKIAVGPTALTYLYLGFAALATLTAIATLLVPTDTITPKLVGYVVGGIIGPIILGLNTVTQRNALRDPNHIPARAANVTIRVTVIVGILTAIIHVVLAASQLSEIISEALLRAGWQL